MNNSIIPYMSIMKKASYCFAITNVAFTHYQFFFLNLKSRRGWLQINVYIYYMISYYSLIKLFLLFVQQKRSYNFR